MLVLVLCSYSTIAGTIDICVAPIPPATSGKPSLANPTGRDSPYQYEVKVGDKVFAQNHKSTKCNTFTIDKRILVVVKDSGQIKESFYIDQSNYNSGICLWFKPLYNTWSAWELKDSAHLCTNRT